MKCDIPVPYERLIYFQKLLGLGREEGEKLDQYRHLFLEKNREFAEYFHHYFHEIRETRIILDHEKRSGNLKVIWSHWFESIFKERLKRELLPYLWRSGLKHVELNIDQRFVNLGYSIVRQFCHRIAKSAVPVADLDSVLADVDKLVDLCLLI